MNSILIEILDRLPATKKKKKKKKKKNVPLESILGFVLRYLSKPG
ncbi:MAG: hypothetical protein AB7P13_04320 [Candidatus Nitrosocosmicus sp.]